MSLNLRYLLIFTVSLGLHLVLLVIPLPYENMLAPTLRYPVGTVERLLSSFSPAHNVSEMSSGEEKLFHSGMERKTVKNKIKIAPPTPLNTKNSRPSHPHPALPATLPLLPSTDVVATPELVPKAVERVGDSVDAVSVSIGYATKGKRNVYQKGSSATIEKTPLAEVGVAGAAITQALPRYDENPRPLYPDVARRKGWSGIVEMMVRVDAAGRVDKLSVVRSSGYSVLDRAARRAVRLWRFIPATQEGHNVTADVVVPIDFRLPGSDDSKMLVHE